MQNAETVLGIIKERSVAGYRFSRMYRNLYNPGFFQLVEPVLETQERERVIEELRAERYRFVTKEDKANQAVLHLIALLIDGVFANKPMSLTEALAVTRQWSHVDYVLQGSLDPKVISEQNVLDLIREKIPDGRFLNLLQQALSHSESPNKVATSVATVCLDSLGVDYVVTRGSYLIGVTDLGQASAMEERLAWLKSSGITDWTQRRQPLEFFGFHLHNSQSGVVIRLPKQTMAQEMRPFMSNGKAVHRGKFISLGIGQIVRNYQDEYYSFCQKYRAADNFSKRKREFFYYHRQSLVKTLASKFKRSSQQILRQYEHDGKIYVKLADGKELVYEY